MVGYNVQSAVDTKNHLILAHEVTNIGNDRAQPSNMAKQAKTILEVEKLDVLADRGYYSGREILACDEDDITTYLPKTNTSGNKAAGLYDRKSCLCYKPCSPTPQKRLKLYCRMFRRGSLTLCHETQCSSAQYPHYT